MKLGEQTVVVTGASAGVGRAIAIAFGQQQARVALIARSATALEDVKREIEEQGGQALALPCDVSDWRRQLRHLISPLRGDDRQGRGGV